MSKVPEDSELDLQEIAQERVGEANETGEAAEIEEAGEPGDLIVFDLRTLSQFREEGPFVQVLSDIGTARTILFAFKAGQRLQKHRTSSQIFVQALRGRIDFRAVGRSVTLQAGMVLQLEANVPHTVIAQTNAVMLLIMTPSPSYHSLGLERKGSQGLTPLVKRTNAD